MVSWVEHEKSFITSGADLKVEMIQKKMAKSFYRGKG